MTVHFHQNKIKNIDKKSEINRKFLEYLCIFVVGKRDLEEHKGALNDYL